MDSPDFWSSVRDSLGPSFTGTAWYESTLLVYGTAPSAPEGLGELGDPQGIEIRYEQVARSEMQVKTAIDWLGQHFGSPDLDVRTAYGSVACGAAVVIVGSAEAAARLEVLAGDAGHGGALLIHVDPDYVVRPRIPATGEQSVTDTGART